MIRTQITSPAPSTPGAAEEFSALQARIQGLYGKGHGTLRGQPINGSDIEEAMATDRNPDELKEMWLSWHDSVGTPMKADYVRMVDIANAGARELGYADTGALWRANYDMSPDQFAALTEKVWARSARSTSSCAFMCAASSTPSMATRCSPRKARSAPTF
jgi:peptidyl-dipeptidase A